MRTFRKAESLRQMRNIEGRINHTQLIEEQRAHKLERTAEKARNHAELLESGKLRRESAEHSESAARIEKERAEIKLKKKDERTARRAAARAEIREANIKLAAMLASRKTESL